MSCQKSQHNIPITSTHAVCPIGEAVGKRNISESKIPVLSCEGACIRGEIARLAANLVAKKKPYGRGCHGELMTVPESAISQWIRKAEKVILIDGCFLRCHGRIIEHLIDEKRLVQFDALSHYNRYTDIFDYEDVPEDDRKMVAQSVADWVLRSLEGRAAEGAMTPAQTTGQCGACCGES
ncbi:MAG: putative zinc-binding protein [Desulfosarcinaceae bacterium]|nr:putative zinc-binding protein [Desulfosarcinaceae bacterium]